MARLAFTLTLLFFLFSFTYALTPIDLSGNDVTDGDLQNFVQESDAKPTLRLPSENTESEPITVVELEPEIAETKSIDTETDGAVGTVEVQPESDAQAARDVPLNRPLTVVRFRPVNRHFRRGCHHGIRPMMRPRFHGREMPYGDDMILGGERKEFDPAMFRGGERKEFDPEMLRGGERKEFDPEMFHGGERQIPGQWMKFHHHHHHHHHHDMFDRQSFRRPFRREEEREEDEGREEREEGGFLHSFRKFLHF